MRVTYRAKIPVALAIHSGGNQMNKAQIEEGLQLGEKKRNNIQYKVRNGTTNTVATHDARPYLSLLSVAPLLGRCPLPVFFDGLLYNVQPFFLPRC